MFSGTNLLTSCHSASCLFSAVFGFRKVSKEIFSELYGTNVKVNYFPWGTRSPEGRRGSGPGYPDPPGVTRGWARAWLGFGPPGRLLGLPFSYKKPLIQKP